MSIHRIRAGCHATILAIVLFGLSVGHVFGSEEKHWGYTGNEGPTRWGELGYPLCSTGKNQSPVDIPAAAAVELDVIQFDYRQSPIVATNNGHTVQFNYAPGSFITVGGKRFELLQFHFHSQSEHTVGGRPAPMEVHLVHKNSEGELAVVGVFFEGGANAGGEREHDGKTNSLDLVFGAFSGVAGLELTSKTPIDATHLLPENRSYYHYMGSLTTPPCSEGVRWFVMRNARSVSSKQLERFRSIFDNNARPAQALHSRILLGLTQEKGRAAESQEGDPGNARGKGH